MTRERWLRAVHAAVCACDPAERVAAGLRDATIAPVVAGRRWFGVAVGKAALAMARGAGAVERGVVVVPAREHAEQGDVPAGWSVIASAHPFVDERSVVAARAARAVVDAAEEGDVVIALISGGASALIEEPIAGLALAELAARTREAMERGAPIAELNALRASLSRIKRGGLVATCAAPVVTLAVSDVIGDSLATIGSGPTIAAEPRARDRVLVVAPMADLGVAAVRALVADAVAVTRTDEPLATDVAACAATIGERVAALPSGEAVLWWGEPTLQVPADHGEGGRAQQLALHLAQALRGTDRAALVIGSDGVDGPPPAQRAAPAGAFVDGDTWDAIVRAGLDPERALARCDAGTVLAAVGALVVTGPTGINHGDLVIVGRPVFTAPGSRAIS